MKNTILKILKHTVLGLIAIVLALFGVIMGAGYFATLPDTELTSAEYPRNTSHYVTMRDGVKIAIDIWYPKQMQSGKRYPTLLHMTRYWRDKQKAVFQRGLIAFGLGSENDILDTRTSWFNDAGYVVVKVDARGTGASFGSRDVEWSRDEITDYGEILAWIGKQSWSNGKVGSFGISYNGNTAEMIIKTGRPELKISAPLYNDFNPFLGLVQPGGAQNNYLDSWGATAGYLDQNDLCNLMKIDKLTCWFAKKTSITGVKPVEGQEDLLELALEDHNKNEPVGGSDDSDRYLDDEYGDTGYTVKDIAPFGQKEAIEKAGVPMVLHLGWLDAATVEGALNRYLTFSNDQHLLIGPFTHGGRMDTDPFKPVNRPVSPSSKEQYDGLIKYFDAFLKGSETRLHPRKQITYYTLGTDRWTTTEAWPPKGFENKTLYFGDNHQLVDTTDSVTSVADTYVVDFTASKGTATRWHTNFGGGDVIYSDGAVGGQKMLAYTTAPLEETIEITGTGVVSLHVSSSHKDNLFLAYLEDVAPDGRLTYITEGVIRADNRKIADRDSLPHKVVGVAHSYLRKDASPMIPGEVTEVQFNLQPISAQINKGHRIRLSIAGADEVMFKRWPKTGTPEWIIYKGGAAASSISLPYKVIELP